MFCFSVLVFSAKKNNIRIKLCIIMFPMINSFQILTHYSLQAKIINKPEYDINYFKSSVYKHHMKTLHFLFVIMC
jgi:hypothetical protein